MMSADDQRPTMGIEAERFAGSSRVLHWLMAPLLLAMLLVGIGMVATVSPLYSVLLAIHRPLGIALLVLALLRIANRIANRPPPLPESLPSPQRLAAFGSHYLLYALMVAMPLIGWGMLSAERYPIVLFGSVRLPPILPHSVTLFAILRPLHSIFAYLLFLTILLHVAAALFHGLIRRDGVLASMASLRAARGVGRDAGSVAE